MKPLLYVKPARAGEIIRDPKTGRVLSQEGGAVPDTTFWQRRRAQGDVVDIDQPAAEPVPFAVPQAAKATTPRQNIE